MFSNSEKNYLINIVLGLIGLACIFTGLILKFKIPALMAYINIKVLHEWTGYAMAAFIILHLLMHLKWVKNSTKTMLSSKPKFIATVLVLVFTISILAGAITMLPASKAPAEGRKGSPSQMNIKHIPGSEQTN